jgi:hypothetical protein
MSARVWNSPMELNLISNAIYQAKPISIIRYRSPRKNRRVRVEWWWVRWAGEWQIDRGGEDLRAIDENGGYS